MDYQALKLDGVPTAKVNLPECSRPDHTDSPLDTSLITEALSQLKPEHRMVIVRAYYRGESIAELADALDEPQGTVKSRLHYGLARAAARASGERGHGAVTSHEYEHHLPASAVHTAGRTGRRCRIK